MVAQAGQVPHQVGVGEGVAVGQVDRVLGVGEGEQDGEHAVGPGRLTEVGHRACTLPPYLGMAVRITIWMEEIWRARTMSTSGH